MGDGNSYRDDQRDEQDHHHDLEHDPEHPRPNFPVRIFVRHDPRRVRAPLVISSRLAA
jgi:hypothetical protein